MNKKKIIRRSIEIALIIIIIIGFFMINDQVTQNKRNSFKPISDKNYYVYQVEKMYIEGEDLVLKGWFFELKKFRNQERNEAKDGKLGIVLYDIDLNEKTLFKGDSQKGISMRMEYQKRQDIDAYFNCEYDYSSCGFIAKVNKDNVDYENRDYQIVFKPEQEGEYGIVTDGNAYIHKGKISYVNPQDIFEIAYLGTDLEKIITEGECLLSYPEKHICVYQYEWKLYWITDSEFDFEIDGTTAIQYQLDTTQFDRLPQNRIDNGWYWSNLTSNFEDSEITHVVDCGRYRVSVKDLPTDYSITRMVTGYYSDGKWVWMRYFRPKYDLLKE